MKKFIFAAVLAAFLIPAVALAQTGYTGPGIEAISVADVLKLKDDAPVRMEGKIVKFLGDEKYEFADATGTVIIDIDNKIFQGLTIGPDDVIEVYGEVDKDFTSFKVDVDRIVKK